MRSIERLPEAIRSSVRSGVVICDLTRIVEELVFNSLDAGATKVSVAVGVGSCYIKVVDNGSGITRDGLVLLGERYATSKVDHLAVVDTGPECLDFHGEALCSISDVSLLEIVTKARGKPNGYRKIMKNSKCLFLGIDDGRQDVGTTVTVRDIFYNQPVRRKHMESSPKKVLDSIKMSVLRIALVHVNIPFEVVDVESADELLHTRPSSSPLPLLSSNFGIENLPAFYELNLSVGELKLSGYISDPRECFPLKAIQYVYINSRFICKGPIHKLLNQLAAKFDLLSSWQPATSFQSDKRKYDVCPTFILNLHCPRSYYDMLTFERSRTSVEFKDWGHVLTVIENGVMRLWTENTSHDMPDTFQSGKKRCRKQQNSQFPLDLCSPQRKKLCKSYDNMSALDECLSSFGKPSRNVSELKRHPIVASLPSETDYLSPSCNESLAGYQVTINKEIRNHPSPCSAFTPANVTYMYGKKEEVISCSGLGNILPSFDDKIDKISRMCGVSAACLKFSDDIHIDQDPGKSFLRGCSFERSLVHERKSSARDEGFEFGTDDNRIRQNWIDYDKSMADEIDLAISGRDLQCDRSSPFQSSPMNHSGMNEVPVFPIVNPSSAFRNILSDSSEQVQKCSSSRQSFRSGWSPSTSEETTGIKFLDDDAFCKKLIEDSSEFERDDIHEYSAQGEHDLTHSNLNTEDSWQQQNCSAINFSCHDKRELGEFHWGDFESMFSPKPFKRSSKTDWSPLLSSGEVSLKNPVEHECGRPSSRKQEVIFNRKKNSIRSHSAPPLYRGKKRYLDLTDSSTVLSAKSNFQNIRVTISSTGPSNSIHRQPHGETRNLECLQKSTGQYYQSPMERSDMDCSFTKRRSLEMTPEVIGIQNGEAEKREQFINMESVECLDLKESWDSFDAGSKWRNCYLPTIGGNGSEDKNNQGIILDISSDILHFAGDSLVPKSIDRTSLEDAKVLNQVDKKFIAVVAGKTLAVIDQHAADERIRLEELRDKVLSGKTKAITYLDAEQELVLPEIGYQLLQNYAEQIQTWGWICNIHSENTSSFTKHLDFLYRQPTVVKLLAVPCILGVKLTNTDLLEYLQQLADTDGSSAIPPSVHRVLNNKACRGAIMFGDTLLASECSLIVDELKRTSLCFQCAHGRPTTVPLVNLDLLHNKIAKLGSDEPWHGLRQHKTSLKRSAKRLSSSS